MSTDPEAEIDFLSKHPGGFDKVFFEQHLSRIVGEYRDHRGLDPSTMEVVVSLRSGWTFSIETARAALTWIVFFTETDEAVFVPYGEIVNVSAQRRMKAPPKEPVGFKVTPVDDS